MNEKQQEVFDSIPKEVYKLPPEEFARIFVEMMLEHPNSQKILKGNKDVEKTTRQVALKYIKAGVKK